MPRKPKRPCGYPGCPELTDGLYCVKHKHLMGRNYNKYERDDFTKTFYNTPEWRAVRQRKLNINPVCECCGKKKATMVDHITPIKQGGSKFDLSNLQSLCWACHSSKSVKEGSRFGCKPRGYDKG